MSSQLDILYNELVESEVDQFLEEDAFYQTFATPLKSASVIKQEHRKQMVEYLKMNDLRNRLTKAEQWIREQLPNVISPEEYEKVKNELDNSGKHFEDYAEAPHDEESDKPVLLQQIFGISDSSLVLIYQLAHKFVADKQYENALDVLVFLVTLAPDSPAFWLALGVCMQALETHQDAIVMFDIAKTLNPTDPSPCIYAAESYLKMGDKDKAKEEIATVESILKDAEPGPWKDVLAIVKNALNS